MVVHGSLDAVAAVGPISILLTVVLGTVGIIVAWRMADRRQRRWVGVLLQDEVAAGTIRADELKVLEGRRKDRKAYLKAIKADKGKDAARHEGHVLDSAIELASKIAATDSPTSAEANAARSELNRVRALAPAAG